jgi:hypothetical protein
MSEQLPEQQKTLLVIRSPLSEDGFVSIYFSSRDGRLMNEEVEPETADRIDEQSLRQAAGARASSVAKSLGAPELARVY